jgi:anthranilate/para-aminobenzoate synthase component I
MRLRPLELAGSPAAIAARWSPDRRLAMLHSGRRHDRWARWTILAAPSRAVTAGRADALGMLRAMLPAVSRSTRERSGVPFAGGWVGYLAYELGGCFEPRAGGRHETAGGWPLVELLRCDDALVHDAVTGRWYGVGRADAVVAALDREAVDPAATTFEVGNAVASMPPDDYLSGVARILDYIRAGDIFQANLTQQLVAPFNGSTRSLAAAAFGASRPWYGGYIELDDGRCVISLSPELFLGVDPVDRRVITRPIKGTRPADGDARELLESAKDAAELNMIVDLMRNDLGRVCEFGTVKVPQLREIEMHPTVLHGVASVAGTLRSDAGLYELLAATFPGGSITGAPKIRAMQIIEELERGPRGPYCGSLGFIGDDGAMTLNIGIRTIVLDGRRPPGRWDRLEGELRYGVGGGIVADSKPEAELRECLVKAAVLYEAVRSSHRPGLRGATQSSHHSIVPSSHRPIIEH